LIWTHPDKVRPTRAELVLAKRALRSIGAVELARTEKQGRPLRWQLKNSGLNQENL
jgi:hypothetical protein